MFSTQSQKADESSNSSLLQGSHLSCSPFNGFDCGYTPSSNRPSCDRMDFPSGCWMRNIKSWNCDSSENRPGKGGSMGSMVKGWIAARIRRNLLLYLDYFQVSFRPSLPSVDPIFYWWHSRSYRVLAQPKTNQILYPLWLIKMKFMGNCPKLRLEGAQILMILGSSLLRCSTEVHA